MRFRVKRVRFSIRAGFLGLHGANTHGKFDKLTGNAPDSKTAKRPFPRDRLHQLTFTYVV
jgi:hypothetical protein